jgi:hypothetical protein
VSAVEPNGPGEPGEPDSEEYPTISEPSSGRGEDPTLQAAAPRETAAADERTRRGGTFDRADPVSIGIGLVFFLIGGAYLLAAGGHLTVNAGWTLSLLLLGLGLSGVVGGLLKSRRGGPNRR